MPKKSANSVKKLRITWTRSAIGYSEIHKATIRALGFHRLHETVEQMDSPAIRGMLAKIHHLVEIEEQVGV